MRPRILWPPIILGVFTLTAVFFTDALIRGADRALDEFPARAP